jgi:AMMECR1 domain-containing protein
MFEIDMRIKLKKKNKDNLLFFMLSLILLVNISGCGSLITEKANGNDKVPPSSKDISSENNNQSTVRVLPDVVPSEICLEDKQKMIRYCYDIFDDFLAENRKTQDQPPPVLLHPFNYDKVFVTLFFNGKMKDGQSSINPGKFQDQIFMNLRDAITTSLKDTTLSEPLSKDDAQHALVIINFVFNKKKMEKNKFDYLKENIRPGIHAVEVKKGDRQAFFNSSIAVVNNYSFKQMLEELCKQADL